MAPIVCDSVDVGDVIGARVGAKSLGYAFSERIANVGTPSTLVPWRLWLVFGAVHMLSLDVIDAHPRKKDDAEVAVAQTLKTFRENRCFRAR